MNWDLLESLAVELGAALQHRGWHITTAESCTGGMVAGVITSVAGSSVWINQAWVSYANEAKESLLGVPKQLLVEHGAVSEPVVLAMASGAAARARADVSVAVSGIAGPGGGSIEKPVGSVWFGWSCNGVVDAELQRFSGDRRAVREAAIVHALRGTIRRVTIPDS